MQSIEETIYFKNIVDGLEMPPYSTTFHRVKGAQIEVPKTHVDESGSSHQIKRITQQEFDNYWKKESEKSEKNEKVAESEKKKLLKKINNLRESAINKLIAGEKLSEEEANFIAGNIGA